MAERTDALDSNAYKDAVADISHAIQNPALWDEVNGALKRGIANGNISYDGLEAILPQVGISGDLINSQFDNLDTDKGNGKLFGIGLGQLSNDEISRAQAYGSDPLVILAANLIQNDRETIEGKGITGDAWWDHLHKDEVAIYAGDTRASATRSLATYLESRDGVVDEEDADGDSDEKDDDDDRHRHDDGECSYDEDCDDKDDGDSDDDEDEDEIAEEARVNDDYFEDLNVDDLKRYLSRDSKDPADRLRAAWELAQRGEKVVTLKNGDDELTVEISTDENGYISLWSQGVNGPLMKGLVKENQVVTQDGSYFGKSWKGAHGEELFDD